MVWRRTDRKKFVCCLSLIYRLLNKEKLTRKKIANDYEVHHATAGRYINELQAMGIPLTEENNVLYLAEDAQLNLFGLSRTDIHLQIAIIELIKQVASFMDDGLNRIFRKTFQGDQTPFYVKAPQSVFPIQLKGKMNKLIEAIHDKKRITFTYHLHKGQLSLNVIPLKLTYYEGFWYLFSQEGDSNRINKYQVLLMEDIRLRKKSSVPQNHKALMKKLDNSVNIWFGEDSREFTVKIDPQIVHYFKYQNYFREQEIEHTYKDGSLRVKGVYSHKMEVLPTIKRWMPHIKIMKPLELKEQMENDICVYFKK